MLPGQRAELTPTMDIFSAGCTLLELFNEGTMTFDLSQLLSYRNGDTELLEKHLDKVEDKGKLIYVYKIFIEGNY